MRKKGWKVISVQPSADSAQPEGNDNQKKTSPCKSKKVKKAGGHINIFIRKIPFLGSVIKVQRPPAIPSEKVLDNLAKKHHTLFIKIEPTPATTSHSEPSRKRGEESPDKEDSSPCQQIGRVQNDKGKGGFQQDTWPLLPTKTLQLDLNQSEKTLWNNLDSDARYSIRKAKKRLKVKCEKLNKTKKLKNFHQILKEAGKRQGFPTPSWQNLKNLAECFGEKGLLIMSGKSSRGGAPRIVRTRAKCPASTMSKNKTVAGCVILIHDGIAYYRHAATTKKGRSLLAGYLVLWKAIKLAKELGCTTFDFEGIYDARYHKRTKAWKGFTYFKKKFGGKEIAYLRPIIKYYSLPIKLLATIFG